MAQCSSLRNFCDDSAHGECQQIPESVELKPLNPPPEGHTGGLCRPQAVHRIGIGMIALIEAEVVRV